MGRRATIARDELVRLVAEGRTIRELADHFGASESGILQAKRAAGIAKRQLDHRAAIPWKVAREHLQSGPATNLRNLSAIAQGSPPPRVKVNTALRWAQRLVDEGLDVRYDPVEGFGEAPAGPGVSHVEKLLRNARKALDED